MRLNRFRARHHPQDEQGCERHHVDDHDLLEPEAVGDLDHSVSDDHAADLPVDHAEGNGDRADRQSGRDHPGGTDRELAGGDRPKALLRMLSVQFDVI